MTDINEFIYFAKDFPVYVYR